MDPANWPRRIAGRKPRDRRSITAVATAILTVGAAYFILVALAGQAPLASTAPAGTLAISGNVLAAADDSPIAGSTVTASSDTAGFATSALTDATGAFTISAVPAVADLVVRARASGFAQAFLNGGPFLDTTAGTSVTDLKLRLGAGASASGIVTRASGGSAISGATVSARSLSGPVFTATSGTDGSFVFTGLPPGTYLFNATAQSTDNLASTYFGGAASRTEATTVPLADGGSTTSVNIAMPAAGAISGFVTNASGGAAVAGIAVTAGRLDEGVLPVTAISDSAGAYRIAGLAPGQYALRVVPGQSTGFGTQIYDGAASMSAAEIVIVDAGEDTEGVDFALATGVGISGFVRAASDGSVVRDAVVTASDFDSGEIVATGRTGTDGAYDLKGISAGKYRLYAEPGRSSSGRTLVAAYFGGAKRSLATAVQVVSSPLTGKDFSLDAGGKISGRVTQAADGAGVPGVRVLAVAAAGTVDSAAAGGVSGGDGAFEIAGLAPGSYAVEFQPPQAQFVKPSPIAATVPSAGADVKVDVALAAGGSLSGKVTAAADGSGVANALITVTPAAGGTAALAATRADGGFAVHGLPAGSYTVRADAPDSGFVTEFFGGALTAAAATTVGVSTGVTTAGVDIVLDSTGAINGTVLGAGSAPVSGVQVTATGLGGIDGVFGTVTDITGAYNLAALPPGQYRVSAPGIGQGFLEQFYNGATSAATATTVVVTAGSTTSSIDFSLSVGGQISGTVTRKTGGTAVAGANVVAVDSSTGAFNSARTGASGAYQIDGLAPGTYTVSAEAPQLGLLQVFFSAASVSTAATPVVVVGSGATAGINFSLPFTTSKAPGSISGVVTNLSSDAAVVGATVRATGFDSGVIAIEATSDSSGAFTISGVPPGDYRVEAQALDQGLARLFYNTAPAADTATRVTVGEGSAVTGIDFALASSGS